jgi:phosphoribosyl 1,2-cyclic phosphate phosphodiesterase
MRLTFLGTSAANAFPEAFCSCANCQQARALGGPSLRKRSAVLVNDDLLIDLGPDVMAGAQMHSAPLTRVRHCLQTHGHADHLDPSHFLSRSPAYGTVGAPRLHFYASAETLQWTAKLLERDYEAGSFLDPEVGEELNLEIHAVGPMQCFNTGAYRVIAVPATHDPGMGSLLYAIGFGGHWAFYGTDTAALSEDVWRAFHDHGLRFDLVMLDHTYGPEEVASDHLGARDVIAHAHRMRAEGLLAEGARVLGTHIAHEGNPAHPDLAAFAAQHGYEIAYDGLVVDV